MRGGLAKTWFASILVVHVRDFLLAPITSAQVEFQGHPAFEGVESKQPQKAGACRLVVVSQDLQVLHELNITRNFLQGARVEFSDDAADQELDPNLVGMEGMQVLVVVDNRSRRLSQQDVSMLRANHGKFERWVALLDTYCGSAVRQFDLPKSALLPETPLTAILEEELRRRGARCREPMPGSGDLLPSFPAEPRGKLHVGTTTSLPVLGHCPGVLFVPSSTSLELRRQLLRKTWLSDFPGLLRPFGQLPSESRLNNSICMDYFFFTGWSSARAKRALIEEERRRFLDLVTDCTVLDGITYSAGLQHKFFKALFVQQQLFPNARFYVRASDDTYVHAERLVHMLGKYPHQRLYFGRAAAMQTYDVDVPMYHDYVDFFGHDIFPPTIVGDVLVISEDVARDLLDLQEVLAQWFHFDDTLGLWLSAMGVRPRGALRKDQEWVEWAEVLRGDVACPDGKLIVSHFPAARLASRGVASWTGGLAEHEIFLEYMMMALSAAVRFSKEPCQLSAEHYAIIHGRLLSRLSELNVALGRRVTGDAAGGGIAPVLLWR